MVLLFVSLIFSIGFHKFHEKKICEYIAKNHAKLYIKMGSDYPSQENLLPSQKAIYWKLIWGTVEDVADVQVLKSLCAREKVIQIIAGVSMLLLLIAFIANVT